MINIFIAFLPSLDIMRNLEDVGVRTICEHGDTCTCSAKMIEKIMVDDKFRYTGTNNLYYFFRVLALKDHLMNDEYC